MSKTSAGLLLYRVVNEALELLLAHPGGPFFVNKDVGAWGIPKGEVNPGEDFLAAACREFHEETGWVAKGPFDPLPAVTQRAGKVVHAWAFEGDYDPSSLRSNTFRMEWPPRSGRYVEAPEVDRVAFFSPEVARVKFNPAQSAWIDVLVERVSRTRALRAG